MRRPSWLITSCPALPLSFRHWRSSGAAMSAKDSIMEAPM
jgi:hypothetical protein